MKAAYFKAHCLNIMDRVSELKEEVIVTKRGKPVVKIVPADESCPSPLFGFQRGSVHETTDILAPIGESWDADDHE